MTFIAGALGKLLRLRLDSHQTPRAAQMRRTRKTQLELFQLLPRVRRARERDERFDGEDVPLLGERAARVFPSVLPQQR